MSNNTDLASHNLNVMGQADICINGGMEISQENGTNSVSIANNTPKYIVDQWEAFYLNSTFVAAAQQISATPTPPSGFKYALQLKTTTGGSLASTDLIGLFQPIEGQRISKLAFGTASAQPITVSFWIYATITGTATLVIKNGSGARSYLANFSINSATTWEYKSITVPGDTSGTWPTDNTVAMYVEFGLGAGSTKQGTNNAWNAGDFWGTSSTTNFFASNNNVVCITGVNVLPGYSGPTAPQSSLIRRHYDQELRACQRYYYNTTGTYWMYSLNVVSAYRRLTHKHPVRMRTTSPTCTFVSSNNEALTVAAAVESITNDYVGLSADVTSTAGYVWVSSIAVTARM